ncbi:MAG: methyltransferase domain-containing protein [Planctomycetota bacterium]
MHGPRFAASLLALGLGLSPILAAQNPAPVESAELGQTRNVHRAGQLWFSGQFGAKDLEAFQANGIERVISARGEGEIDWDEASALQEAGVEFIRFPVTSPDSLNAETFGRIRDVLQNLNGPTLFHCGSANRVGACWVPYRVLDEGVPVETALEEAKTIGLRSEMLRKRAIDYVAGERARRAREEGVEDSVKEGINRPFKDPNLVPEEFLEAFEGESREVFAQRSALVGACGIESGMTVADIGAGTGLFTFPFAERTGPDGFVYAVDIAPAFVARIVHQARSQEIRHIGGVVCVEDSVGLAPGSVDLAYVCDTYHHFEFPQTTLASIRRALRPGGRLVIVDFERIPGVSRDWVLRHVRCGKEIVRSEVEAAGFEFSREISIDGIRENFVLEFRAPAASVETAGGAPLARSGRNSTQRATTPSCTTVTPEPTASASARSSTSMKAGTSTRAGRPASP